MKMFKRAFALLLAAAAVAGGMAACDDGPEDTPSSFDITVEQSSDYEIEAPSSAAPLDDVEFTVTVKNPDKYVAGATYNGEDCFGSDGEYSFIMPTEDVVLKAVLADYEEVLSDGVVTFTASNARSIAVGDSNHSYWDDDNNLVDCWRLDISLDWGAHNTALGRNSYVRSTNQAVIPDGAITFVPADKASDGNWYYGVDVRIDTSKISVGSTWLIMYFQSYNSSSKDGRICVKMTVTEEAVAPETMQVVFTYQNTTQYPDEDVFINITDNADDTSLKTIYLKDFTDGEYVFEYAVGHTYSLSCAYATYNEEEGKYENMTSLSFNPWRRISVGSALNSLERDGQLYKLTLTTEGIEVPLVIVE